MNITENWKEQVLSVLSPSQRIELAMELWDSVPAGHQQPQPSESQIAELRRRVSEADASRMASSTWNEVRQRLLQKSP